MVFNRRLLQGMVAAFGTLILVLIVSPSGLLAQEVAECTIWVQPGESIQAAIDAAPEGAVICLVEGEWVENLRVENPITLRGAGAEHSVIRGSDGVTIVRIGSHDEIQVAIESVTIAGANDVFYFDEPVADGIMVLGTAHVTIANSIIRDTADSITLWDQAHAVITKSTILNSFYGGIKLWESARAMITNCTITGSDFDGIWILDSAQATITNSMIRDNRCGILLHGSAQATITNCTISDNSLEGILLSGSAWAAIEGNEIAGNEDYGIIILFESPCCDTDQLFTGYVAGSNNSIPGSDEPDGNEEGAFCPNELSFLTTKQGGELDRRE